MMAPAGGSGTTAGPSGSTAGRAGAAGGASGARGGGSPGTGAFIREGNPGEISVIAVKGKYTVKSYTSGFAGVGLAFLPGTLSYPTVPDLPFASVPVVPGFTALQ